MNRIAQSIASGFIKSAALRHDTKLQKQQERIVKKIQKEPGLLVYHGLGSGKTLASIAAAEALGGRANVVVPAALRENYRKEIARYVGKPSAKYNITSYEQASKKGLPSGRVSIFDEAHRLGRLDSRRSHLAHSAPGKVILLSGTPLRNEPAEILPILRAVSKDRPIPKSKQAFEQRFVGTRKVNPGFFARLRGVKAGEERFIRNKQELANLIRGRVDYHPSSGEFPAVNHKFVESEMTPTQTDLYNFLMNKNPALAYKIKHNLPPDKKESRQLNAFYSGIRQVSNDPRTYDVSQTGRPAQRSPKIRRMFGSIMTNLAKDPGHRHLVYSNYLTAGVGPLSEELQSAGVKHAIFHGGLSDTQRKKIVDDYNSGKLQVLMVSGAGAEGLDLKGTRTVQVMEPHWNAARIRQVIGRAVRNRSHAHLPPEQRNVNVEYHIAKPFAKPSLFGFKPSKTEMGADKYMMERAKNKQRIVDEVLDVFKEQGSIHGP